MNAYKPLAIYIFISLLFVVNATLVCADERLNSEFRVAAGMGKIEKVKSFLEQGAEVNSRAPGAKNVPPGGTAIMLAAANNHIKVVKLLISHGADINHADAGGGTALIYSVWKGNKDMVALLLENGANIRAKTKDGRTPLSVAVQYEHTDIIQLLKAQAEK